MAQSSETKPFLRILIGATASGKEEVALACALRCDAEIISVDSMKIYRGLEIGTAKPTPAARARVPHHCLDLAEPDEEYNVAKWVEEAQAAISDIARRGKRIILVGGTALYYKGLLEGLFDGPPASPLLRQALYHRIQSEGAEKLHAELRQRDSLAAARIHPHDARRLVRALEVIMLSGQPLSAQQQEWQSFAARQQAAPCPKLMRYPCAMVGLYWPQPEHKQRIARRISRMLECGLIAEAQLVYENRKRWSRTLLQAVAYKEFFPWLEKRITLEEACTALQRNTQRLAKAQRTWFRKFPCTWLDMSRCQNAEEEASKICRIWDETEWDANGLHNYPAGHKLEAHCGGAEI